MVEFVFLSYFCTLIKRIYEIIDEKIAQGIVYSGLNHWGRDCAYEEAVGVANKDKDQLKNLLRIVRFLKQNEFPRHYGLYENNVIFRKHSDQTVIRFDELWWDLYNNYPQRDQLSHPYCYRACGLAFDYLLPKEFCSRNHPYFKYVKHPKGPDPHGVHRLFYDIRRKWNSTLVRIASLF